MSTQKTPLQIFVEVLTGQNAPVDAQELRALARRHAYTRRAREIAEYLIAAAERLPREKKAGGSLKHVLWVLRDVAGDLYEPAAREVLQFLLLSRPNAPLTNVLPHVRHLPTVGVFYEQMAEAQDWRALARYLEERRIGPWRVAVNTTPRNLTDVAMRLGYDVMVAQSEKGTVVKARRGLQIEAARLPGREWKQVYSDLVIWTGTAEGAPAVEDILAALAEAVGQR